MLILGLQRLYNPGLLGYVVLDVPAVCVIKAFFPYINGNFQQDHILKRSVSFTCYFCIISSLLIFFR